ncbi:PspC domain-containing protein [Sporolactobacillus kofuensis]|uniref:PspC domain-containing protein n=1 Tax=Sporolactobacillus kofuensis TaxID=269672 RepID=A0ABW1WGI5_9BACL|nr:PspC domain-containing protein [Sporolactobacillus kofuensis]MCO7176464.1 PspC domain-containing protein [Sporolactobacillus kofuensis]
MQKRLYRSEKNRFLGGVLGGIGEYFSIDPTLVRLGFLVVALFTAVFPCILGYLIAYFIIPEQRV